MAEQYIVNKADLVSVADAIRTKGATEDKLAFPNGFVKAVSDISAGSSVEDPYIKEYYDPFEIQGQIITGYLTKAELHGYTKIRPYLFFECPALQSIEGMEDITEIGEYGFSGCGMLQSISLPEGLVTIGTEAFASCSSINFTTIPASVETIMSMAFAGCKRLTSITFKGTPTTIEDMVFTRCTNLKTINVPWAEGAVAGAPWSATEATINYNYTE